MHNHLHKVDAKVLSAYRFPSSTAIALPIPRLRFHKQSSSEYCRTAFDAGFLNQMIRSPRACD
jgi:hypothetical protein